MTNSNQNQFTVRIYVDQKAACLAGFDQHGTIERTVNPSELTERQRKTLVDINFTLGKGETGAPISGAETLGELLERAADKIEADKAKEQQRIDEAVEILTRRLIEASPYNPHHINQESGIVEFETNKHALIQIDALTARKQWLDGYFFRYVGNLCFSNDKSVNEIRERVLSNADVDERLATLEDLADHIQGQLNQAKETRNQIAEGRKIAAELAAAEVKEREAAQLRAFVETMPEIDRRKFEAGLLPRDEILFAMSDCIFKFLDKFEAVDRPALYADAEDYLSEYGGTVQELTREVTSLTDEQFLTLESIEKAALEVVNGAVVEPLKLVLYSDNATDAYDPEIEYVIARVTVKHGEFEFRRDCMLLETDTSAEG